MNFEILPQVPGSPEKLVSLYSAINWNTTQLFGRILSEENRGLVAFIVQNLEQFYRDPSRRLRNGLDFFCCGSHSNESFSQYDICMNEELRTKEAFQIADSLEKLLGNLPDELFWEGYKSTEKRSYPISGIIQELIGTRSVAFSLINSRINQDNHGFFN